MTGLHAMSARRSLATQDEAELGGRWSVLTLQRREHARLDELLRALRVAPREHQDALLLDLRRLVFPHAFAEEAVLWPLVRRHLSGGEQLTLEVEQEHQEVNELAVRLEKGCEGPDRAVVLQRLSDVLRADVRDEEDVLLPRLQAAVTTAALRRHGLAWLAVRRLAPTRAHPVVARRPPGNVVSALPLSVLDRARDRIEPWTARPGPAGRALTRLDAVLRTAAGAIERLPPMRRGERAATRR